MEDFLKSARKQLDELDLQGQFKDLDLTKIKDVDLKKSGKDLKRQMLHREMQKREQDAANEGFVGGTARHHRRRRARADLRAEDRQRDPRNGGRNGIRSEAQG
jgi:hypothetical protein